MQTYEIKNTSGEIIFMASLPTKTPKYKLAKLAVEQAIKAGISLQFADFSGAYLYNVNFNGANLQGANLQGANLWCSILQHAILKDAILPDGVPYIPNLDKLIYEQLQLPKNKLEMLNWHTCNTTHCRYGWAIHLAGKAGYDLQAKFEPEVAGALIYAKAYPDLPIPAFTGTNEEVMADIKMRAGV